MRPATRTEYLYNIKPELLRDMPYLESLHFRKQHAKDLIATLIEEHYYARDEERISAIHSAIRWCDRAIKELK